MSLEPSFYERDVVEVAAELIGCTLHVDGVGGVIVETEAYDQGEPACHAYVGLTKRTSVIFGPPGHAYVYLSYGIHNLFNVVCGEDGYGAAVLIRALEPTDGVETMRERRAGARSDSDLCSGPGKLGEALGITLEHNRAPLDSGSVVVGPGIADLDIAASPRIGITKARDLPWRFCLRGSPWLSAPG